MKAMLDGKVIVEFTAKEAQMLKLVASFPASVSERIRIDIGDNLYATSTHEWDEMWESLEDQLPDVDMYQFPLIGVYLTPAETANAMQVLDENDVKIGGTSSDEDDTIATPPPPRKFTQGNIVKVVDSFEGSVDGKVGVVIGYDGDTYSPVWVKFPYLTAKAMGLDYECCGVGYDCFDESSLQFARGNDIMDNGWLYVNDDNRSFLAMKQQEVKDRP